MVSVGEVFATGKPVKIPQFLLRRRKGRVAQAKRDGVLHGARIEICPKESIPERKTDTKVLIKMMRGLTMMHLMSRRTDHEALEGAEGKPNL